MPGLFRAHVRMFSSILPITNERNLILFLFSTSLLHLYCSNVLQKIILSRSGSHAPRSEAVQSAQEILRSTLKFTEKALNGSPIPSAKGIIGTLLKVIVGLEVSSLHARSSFQSLKSENG